jgi:hypothetical protein
MDSHKPFASRMRFRIPRRALTGGMPLGRGPDQCCAHEQAISRYVGSGP